MKKPTKEHIREQRTRMKLPRCRGKKPLTTPYHDPTDCEEETLAVLEAQLLFEEVSLALVEANTVLGIAQEAYSTANANYINASTLLMQTQAALDLCRNT